MSLNMCRLESPSESGMTSPVSGDYENDRSDFESGNVSPKQTEEASQEHGLHKKEISRSKTETKIDAKRLGSTGKDRHSTGELLTDVHAGTGTAKQNKFKFSPKRKRSSGDYPPIPPKPAAVVSTSSSSPKSSVSAKSSKSNSPSFIRSLSPKTNVKSPKSPPYVKSPPLDSSSPKNATTRSPTRSPQRSSYTKSHTFKKKDNLDDADSRYAGRCATMSSQEAFHEHHMNKKRRRKNSDKALRRMTTCDDGSNPTLRTGSTLLSSKYAYQFSADMEERLQQKIEQGIESTYGPIEKCIQAAITIQRYYRRQKMVQRFKTLRKEVFSVATLQPSRPRAASMRVPARAYSIRLKNRNNTEPKVSILDEFPEYRQITNRIASRNKLHPLSTSIDSSTSSSKDLGPHVRWRREASFEMQETVLQITDKSSTPVRTLSATGEAGKNDDDVFSPSLTPSPDTYSPTPDSDTGQDITQKPSGVPMSFSVDFLSSGIEEEATVRPHSISIMHHVTRSKSMEELLIIDNETGKPKKQQLKPQESATSLKKKTNIGITLFNRSVSHIVEQYQNPMNHIFID